MSAVTLEQARAAKAEAQDIFEKLGEVVGVGITKIGPDYAIKVNLREPLSSTTPAPRTVRGVPVKLDLIGRIRNRT